MPEKSNYIKLQEINKKKIMAKNSKNINNMSPQEVKKMKLLKEKGLENKQYIINREVSPSKLEKEIKEMGLKPIVGQVVTLILKSPYKMNTLSRKQADKLLEGLKTGELTL